METDRVAEILNGIIGSECVGCPYWNGNRCDENRMERDERKVRVGSAGRPVRVRPDPWLEQHAGEIKGIRPGGR